MLLISFVHAALIRRRPLLMMDSLRALDTNGRRTFWSCFTGYAVDSMDVQLYPFVQLRASGQSFSYNFGRAASGSTPCSLRN